MTIKHPSVFKTPTMINYCVMLCVTAWLLRTKICAVEVIQGINHLRLPTAKDNNSSVSSVAFTNEKSDNFNYASSFTTTGATKESYGKLIKSLRNLLVSDLPPVHGIKRTREPRTLCSIYERFILVNLTGDAQYTITLAIDVTDVWLVGYRTDNVFYYFPDKDEQVEFIFPDLQHKRLPFESTYSSLALEAGSREYIPLGMNALGRAIGELYEYIRGSLGRAFTVVIQMVVEAARFSYIEDFILKLIRGGSDIRPNNAIIVLEYNWGTLAEKIQHSREGILDPPAQFVDSDDETVTLTSVTPTILLNMAIMLFVCNNPEPNSNHNHLSSSQLTSAAAWSDRDGICTDIPEPTTRISGLNGHCVDVQGEKYNDGNFIILWPCKSNEDANQLWTIKADGTIRSNGMCLTTEHLRAGAKIIIHDCNTADEGTTRWQIWENGTIYNPTSSLVLTCWRGYTGANLSLEQNQYLMGQGWVVGNNTIPIVTPIIPRGTSLCIHNPNEDIISLAPCVCPDIRQLWAIYPDGSIRSHNNRDFCLTKYQDYLHVETCVYYDTQRWSFNADKTISNLLSGFVMVAEGNRVRAYPRNDKLRQKWDVLFL